MIREMFKKFKEIKYCTYLYLFLFLFFTNETFAKDNLDKEFDKFKNTTKEYQKKLKDLPKGDSKESIIIDKAIKEITQAVDFVNESYKADDIESAKITLDFIQKSISDIEKLIPQEITSDMSEVDMTTMSPEDMKKIKKITDGMKVNKKQKTISYIKDLNSISQKGLNPFSITYKLNNLGVQTINFEEIAKAINDNPSLKKQILKSIKNDLKKAKVSTKEIKLVSSKMELGELTQVSLTTSTEDSDEIKKAREALKKAKKARKAAKEAKTEADVSKKVADEASKEAQRLSEEAKDIADKKSDEYKDAVDAAKQAKKDAKEAKQAARDATKEYQDALDAADVAQELADAAEGGEFVMAQSIQDRIDEKFKRVKSMKDHTKDNFTKETALAARTAMGDYDEKGLAEKAAAETRKLVYEAAIAKDISSKQANILADNASTEFLDLHFEIVQTKASLIAQGMDPDDARKHAEQVAIDKYGVWGDRLWGPEEDDYDPDTGEWEYMIADEKAVNTWLTGVETLQDLSKKIYEVNKDAEKTRLKVIAEALKQGLSKDKAEALGVNAFMTVHDGLNLAYTAYDSFIKQGYTEEDAFAAAERVAYEKYGDWINRLFSDDNEGDVGDISAIRNFISGITSMESAAEWAVKNSYTGRYSKEIGIGIQATHDMLFEKAIELGMSEKDAEDFASNGSNYARDFFYVAVAFSNKQRAATSECDEACWDARDKALDDFIKTEFKDGDLRIYNDDHNWEVKEGGNFIPDQLAIDIYVTGVFTTDASAELQEAANNAAKIADEAEKKAQDYILKKQEADEALKAANNIKDKSSEEYKTAKAKAVKALADAEAALNIAKKAKNLSKEAMKTLEAARKNYNKLKKELEDLLANLPKKGVPKKGVYYPKGPPKNYPKDWKGKPDLKGMKNIAAQEAAKPERLMKMGKISGNPALAKALNGMTDAAVYKLLESGALSSDFVKEYIADGANAPIIPTSEYKEAARLMDMSSVESNPALAEALNGMTDKDVYELFASGALDSNLVNEYIADGVNAPVLPCGSSECEMIPGTFYNGELWDPNNEFPSLDMPIDPIEIVGRPPEEKLEPELEELKKLKESMSDDAIKALSELSVGGNLITDIASGVTQDLAGQIKQDIAAVTKSLQESGAVIRGATGEVISASEAYNQMPEGGIIQDDGTLLPCHAGNVGAEGC